MKKQIQNTQREITQKLACAMENAIRGVEPGKRNAGNKQDLPAGMAMDYKEMEGAAMSLLRDPGKDFTDKEKSFFVLLAWYCLRKQEASHPMQEEHQAA